jgi:hypothetical protein
VTSDLDNFWRAFDLAAKETDQERKIAIFQTEYLDKGSTGLKDFVRLRIKTAKNLVETIDRVPRFYASVRAPSLRIAEMEKQMRKSFRRFKKLYPAAVFPDVYFLIGVSNTGGTASGNGLLIGTELFSLTAQTPRDELSGWLKNIFATAEKDEKQLQARIDGFLNTAFKPVEKLPAIVAHESCHFNQKFAEPKTLLGKSIQEGSCDFVGEMISGETINPEQKAFGDRHEAALWREFEAEMDGTNFRNWMYNGLTVRDKPMDLGYYMGYKISRSYYKNATDKRQALRDIFEVADFPAFLEKSRYRESLQK